MPKQSQKAGNRHSEHTWSSSGFELEADITGTSAPVRDCTDTIVRRMIGKRIARENRPPNYGKSSPMRMLSALALLLLFGVTAGLHAQTAIERVVILPDQIAWKTEPFSPYPGT